VWMKKRRVQMTLIKLRLRSGGSPELGEANGSYCKFLQKNSDKSEKICDKVNKRQIRRVAFWKP